MNKIILGLLFFLCQQNFSQSTLESKVSTKKFMIGINYSGNIRSKKIISAGFNGIAGIDAKYSFLNKTNFNLSAGLSMDYLKSRDTFFPKDVIIFNPNFGVDFVVKNSKFNPYFNLGYAFFYFKYKFSNQDPVFPNREIKSFFGGVSVNPGVRYFFKNNFYGNVGYKLIPFSENNMDGTSDTHILNFGVGFKL